MPDIRIAALSDSLSWADNRLSAMSANKSEATARLSDELRDANREKDSLKRIIAEKDGALNSQQNSSKSEIERLRKEKAKVDDENTKLKRQISTKNKQITDKDATIKQQEATIKKLQSDLFNAVN